MAKSKRRYRKPKTTIPVAVVVGGFPLIASVIRGWRNETFRGFMVNGTIPLVAGVLIHKFIGGSLGVNRALGRAHVPFLRI